jgi:hypothetical protein
MDEEVVATPVGLHRNPPQASGAAEELLREAIEVAKWVEAHDCHAAASC